MSREIKFRGRSLTTGTWVYGSLVAYRSVKTHPDIYEAETDQYIAVWAESVGQSTGLKDKNGAEIYEGDIVSSTYHPYKDHRRATRLSEIEWGEHRSSYYDDLVGVGFNHPYGAKDSLTNSEVIGNIYENPELLEIAS